MAVETEVELFAPLDAARACQKSTATIKRVADELRLPVVRTVGGIRLFSREQVEKIKAEMTRREREAVTR